MLRRIAFLVFGSVLASLPDAAAAQGPPVSPRVHRAIERDGRAVAAVVLEDPTRPGDRLDAACGRIEEASGRLLARLPSSCRVRYRYRYSPVVLVEIGKDGLDAIAGAPGVRAVHADLPGTGALLESKACIGADRIEEDLGLSGDGRVVAVLDSGVDADNEDLAGTVIHEHHFLDKGKDVGPGAEDEHGHGTHVTGIIASQGNVAPRGIAPGAAIVAVRVLDRFNSGWASDWAAGLEYVIDLHREDNGISIDAVNMSFATYDTFEGTCDEEMEAFSECCRVATELGITIVAASGNNGRVGEMSLPGCFSSLISVGSTSDVPPKVVSSFTNRSERLDLLAPGEDITSVRLGGGVRTQSGTSQAAPHVSAVAALMRESAPGILPAEVLGVLEVTGAPIRDSRLGLEFPLIDAAAALEPLVEGGDCDGDGVLDFIEEAVHGTKPACVPFHRGDANHDGEFDGSDPVFLLLHLFAAGGGSPDCLDAADANDDERLDISDPILMLEYLFKAGKPPPAPGPPGEPCGRDPDPGGAPAPLGCERYHRCGM